MFTVGEFARLAQVSKRLLRYYDEIGLLKPVNIDASSGYRYYSAEQMTDLNRILALKELGLSLDQIRRTLSDHVSTDEIQGMLLLKKMEIERQLQEEIQRIRKIESRLEYIHDEEMGKPLNVIMKEIPSQSALSMRRKVETFEDGVQIFGQIKHVLSDRNTYGFCFCICHDDDIVETNMDLEIGCLLEVKTHKAITLHNGLHLEFRELEGAATMATTVVQGALETIHRGYADIAKWIERNDYQLAGIPREITLQLAHQADGGDLVTEIQFPVQPQ